MIPRRHGRDHHRRLGLAEQLRHHRPDLVDRLFQARHGYRRRAVPEALQRASVGCGELGILQEHVDQGWRQERMGDATALNEIEKLGEIGFRHNDDPPPERQDRETQDAGGVGERRQSEIDRAAFERIAHQRERGHRLQIAPRKHDAFGLAGGAAGARDHRDVVHGRDLERLIADAIEPRIQRWREGHRLVEADEKRQLGQVGPHLHPRAARKRYGRSGSCSRKRRG